LEIVTVARVFTVTMTAREMKIIRASLGSHTKDAWDATEDVPHDSYDESGELYHHINLVLND
jgi:hypothetical protein